MAKKALVNKQQRKPKFKVRAYARRAEEQLVKRAYS
jgi:hypothetical protein